MREPFPSLKDLDKADTWLTSYLLRRQPPISERLLHSTRLTDLIYQGFRLNDNNILPETERKTVPNFEALRQDLFTALFSPVIRQKDIPSVLLKERFLNKTLLDIILRDDRFNILKSLCEDKELPAYDAANTFCRSLQEAVSKNGSSLPNLYYFAVIEKLSGQSEKLIKNIQLIKFSQKNVAQEKLLRLYNKLFRKLSQIEDLQRKLQAEVALYISRIASSVGEAIDNALNQAIQTSTILKAWGDSSGTMQNTPVNQELLNRVKSNNKLMQVAVSLGKYREILADKRKNSFSFGRGEKYDVAFGNDITNCLSSELALLGTAETEILFLRKYEQERLMQYRKRAAIVKGKGDIIVLLDESSSTRQVAEWAKAFALALLDIAAKDKRKYALVHFSSKDEIKTDLFEPGQYRPEDTLKAAEHFFDGGTDFEAPLKEALWLMERGYENADITIITDGECGLSDDFIKNFRGKILSYRATVTGILLDKGGPCGESLIPFCDKIYHAKELSEDEIAVQILRNKVS